MPKLRFGICGLGFMGRSHFARLRDHPRAEIVAVCDRDPRRRAGDWQEPLGNLDLGANAAPQAALAGVATYETPEELIADPRVDAVLITLPTPLHAPVAIAALKAGKHVLTEKPMAAQVSECTRMIEAARLTGRTLMVAHCLRFWPQYVAIKQAVDEGRIGAVRFMTLRRLASPPTYSAQNWLRDAAQSGGALLDLHIHDVDFVHYMLGMPEAVYARGLQNAAGGIDHVVATYRYADGCYAALEGGWTFTPPWPFEMAITVHGERGTVTWNSTRGDDVLLYRGGTQPETIRPVGDALRAELDYFIDCVSSGRPVERCSPVSSRISVALAWLERRSVETGRTMQLSPRLRAAWES
jgi:1,5-anhydro-D-fructose reductase (1,5-anhydro-D-mannitol-forming)